REPGTVPEVAITGPMSDDERAILAVYAGATEPLDWRDVVESLLPRRPRGPRRGGKRAWAQRWEQMMLAAQALFKAGLLADRPEGPADMTAITEAGREALGPIPSGLITTGVTLSREEAETWRKSLDRVAQAPPDSGSPSAPSGGPDGAALAKRRRLPG